MSTANPLPTCAGLNPLRRKLRTGVKMPKKNSKIFLYLPVSLALYGKSLEKRNNPMMKMEIISLKIMNQT